MVDSLAHRLQVIQAYFEDKGLVRQQLDSFNEFINTTIQEVAACHTTPVCSKPVSPQSEGVSGEIRGRNMPHCAHRNVDAR